MKCVICDRSLTVAALTVQSKAGPLVFGPVCARRVQGVGPRTRQAKVEPVRDRATVDWVEEVRA